MNDMKKGQIMLSTLIGLLVFLVILFVAVLPIVSTQANAVSASNTSALGSLAASTTTVGFLVPLLLALAGLVTVAAVLFRRA